ARIKANLGRVQVDKRDTEEASGKRRIEYGKLVVEPAKRKVLLDGSLLSLTPKEFDLLELFATHPGQTFSRDELLTKVWGYQFEGYDHTVNSHINRLRNKIEADPSDPLYLKTVWGVGYRFVEQEELSG